MGPLETAEIFKKAESLKEKSRYNESLKLFREALRGFRASKDVRGILECDLSIGDVNRMIGNFDAAENAYGDAVDISGAIDDAVRLSDAKTGLGLSFRGKGDWANAIKMFRDALRLYKKKEDRQGAAFVLWAMAGALRIKGDIPKAIKTYHESLALFKALRSRQATGYCLCGLGGTSRIAGLFEDSLRFYMSANKLFSDIKDEFGTAYSYCGIGNARRMRKEYAEALSSFRRASTLYNRMGDKVSYAYTLWSIGTTYKMLNRHGKAMEFFRNAQRLFRKTKDPRGNIYCVLGFGEIALMEGKKGVAETYVSSCVEEAKRYGFRVEKCHSEMLFQYLRGKLNTTCYNKLGLRLKFDGVPFNIP